MIPTLPKRPTTTKLKKQFTIQTWDGSKCGEKIILYAETGMGKTTLASMAPNPVFIGLDDGGRKILNPKTGEHLKVIPDVTDFQDVRDALNACLSLDCETVVIDTITELESWAETWTLKHVAGPSNSTVVNIESYGYNKGYKHLYDTMRLPLLDCDKLIQAGKNVLIVAQSTNNKVANSGGEDYICNGPQLYNGKPSILSLWSRWADHILRIDYASLSVKNKKSVGDTTRTVYTQPETYYMAKTRQLKDGSFLPPAVTFKEKDDDSIWQLLFKKGA